MADAAYLTGESHLTNGDHVTYTVPQQIATDHVERNVNISFRVNRSFGESEIFVTSGGAVLARYRRSHMAPGEMEHIALPKALLEKITTDTLTVLCKEAEA